jgi:hypothetical protein
MIHSASFLGYTRLGAETTASQTDLREVSGVYYLTGGFMTSSLTEQAIRLWYSRYANVDGATPVLAEARGVQPGMYLQGLSYCVGISVSSHEFMV